MAYIFLAIGLLFEFIANFFLCRWGKLTDTKDLIIGISLHAVNIVFWVIAIKCGMAFWKAGVLWTLGSLVFCVIIGMMFQERPSLINLIGVALALAAAILVEMH
jgi:multidrug transporter EmrE-like cation transporter